MTVEASTVTMLRETVAEWIRAGEAGDLDGTRAAGAYLVGVVEVLLTYHDARGLTGGESE